MDLDPLASDARVADFLGAAYESVVLFGQALAEQGVRRGLLGPREVPRLWERHLLNSAAVGSLLPTSGTLVDVGSGAGLPGVVLAALRPEMRVVLLEPMERRVRWLEHVRALTGLANIEVVRGRAEEVVGSLQADVVTARAVAPMGRLAGWTLPLLRRGGVLLALKGRQAAEELAAATEEIMRLGGGPGEVLTVGTLEGLEETTVVRIVRQEVPRGPVARSTSARPRSAGRSRAPRGAGGTTGSGVGGTTSRTEDSTPRRRPREGGSGQGRGQR